MKKPIDIDHLPKDRRDWLEIFGNQWGPRSFQRDPMTPDEKHALELALNPFAK